MHPAFDALHAHACAGSLAAARAGADADVAAFLDRNARRLARDPAAMLLACAAEDPGPVGVAAADWLARTPTTPAFVRRVRPPVATPERVVLPGGVRVDARFVGVDAAGTVAVVVDEGRWPGGHELLVFDLGARRCRAVLRGDARWSAEGVAVAPDGTWAVVLSGRLPKIVDLRTDTVRVLPKGHRGTIQSVAIASADTFVTGGEDGVLHVWRRDGTKLRSTKAHPDTYVMGLSVRDEVVWSTGFDERICAWRLPDLTPVTELATPEGWTVVPLAGGDLLTRVARLAPDGTRRYSLGGGPVACDEAAGFGVSGAVDGLVVFDLATGTKVGGVPGFRAAAVACAAGRAYAVDGTADLHVFPLAGLAAGPAPAEDVRCIELLVPSPDGRAVLAAEGAGGSLGQDAVELGAVLEHGRGLHLHDADGAHVAALRDARAPHAFVGGLLLTRGPNGALQAWEPATGRRVWSARGALPDTLVGEHEGRVFAAATPEGLLAVIGADEARVDLRSPTSGEVVGGVGGHWGGVRACFTTADALWLSTDRSVVRVDAGRVTWEVTVADPRSMRALGDRVAVISGATIRMFAAADGADLGVCRGRFKKPLRCLAAGGALLWSGGEDGHLRAWDPRSFVQVRDIAAWSSQPVRHVTASAGHVLAIGGIWAHRLYDAHTGALLREPFGSLTHASLDALDRLLVEASYGDDVDVLDLPSGLRTTWVADRENCCAAAVGRRIFLGWRVAPGPVEVLEWLPPR